MKRRKKLWIAFAALAVVVVLCVVAVLYRVSPPYQFLHDSRIISVRVDTVGKSRTPSQIVVTGYLVAGAPDAVLAAARREITIEREWTWQEDSELTWAQTEGISITVFKTTTSRNDRADVTEVYVVRDATSLDSFEAWIRSL